MSTKNAKVTYLDDHGIHYVSRVKDVSSKRLTYQESGTIHVLNKQGETIVVVPTGRLLSIEVTED